MLVDARVEMFLHGDWVDVSAAEPVQVLHEGEPVLYEGVPVTFGWTAERLRSQQLQIRRGRSDRAAHAEPASVQVVLDNHDGQLTPDDPRSRWWPHLTRGTPLRVLVAHEDDWLVRFSGEVASIRPEWPQGDPEAPVVGDSLVHIQAAGVLRRLGGRLKASAAPLMDLLGFKGWDGSVWWDVWPLEDGSRAPLRPNLPVIRLQGSSPQLGSDDTLPGGGGSLPVLQSGELFLPTSALGYQLAWLVRLTPGLSSLGRLRWMSETHLWDANLALSGRTLSLSVTSTPAGEVVNTTPPVEVVAGVNDWVLVTTQLGTGSFFSDLSVGVYPVAVDSTPVGVYADMPFHLEVLPVSWRITATGSTVGWVHASAPAPEQVAAAAAAYTGETPTDRIARLAATMGVDHVTVGDHDPDQRMGPQEAGRLIDIAQAAAALDLGVLAEQLDQPGLRYRTRDDLCNQTPVLVLDADRSEIANPFAPVLDDQRLVNQVAVSRPGGATFVARDDESINGPTGLYDTSLSLNVAADHQVVQHAGWRLHLGTWPGMRYPAVTVDLAIAPHLIPEVTAVREGDRIQVVNLPSQHPAGTVDLLVEGITETIMPSGWTVEFTCSPAGPWMVAVAEDPARGRLDTAGCVLAVDVDAEETTWLLDTTVGPEWITTSSHPDEFPFDLDVGGEVVTVTGITGTGTQTATVIRAVNGVAKSHPAGTPVRLAQPAVLAL